MNDKECTRVSTVLDLHCVQSYDVTNTVSDENVVLLVGFEHYLLVMLLFQLTIVTIRLQGYHKNYRIKYIQIRNVGARL